MGLAACDPAELTVGACERVPELRAHVDARVELERLRAEVARRAGWRRALDPIDVIVAGRHLVLILEPPPAPGLPTDGRSETDGPGA